MKKIGLRHIIVIILFAAFCCSIASYMFSGKQRRTFSFPIIGSDELAYEVRYLPRHPVQGDICLYIDELLLGPQTQRACPLFSAGTKNDFCFMRDKILYIGLSKDVLYEIPEAARIKDGIVLFEKNIRKNFRGVKEIALFIDGKYVE